MPQHEFNCVFIAILAQVRGVPLDYSPEEFRYCMVRHFCQNLRDFIVS